MLHVTCKIDALYLVAETIRQSYPEVDALITNTKAVFCKSPKRIRDFHRKCPGIPEPPQSIVTEWETWLRAALYYSKYFEQTKTVVLQFNPEEAAAIKKITLK